MNDLIRQRRELRQYMKANGIRRISCFNAGLSAEEYRCNAKMFDLETKIKDQKGK